MSCPFRMSAGYITLGLDGPFRPLAVGVAAPDPNSGLAAQSQSVGDLQVPNYQRRVVHRDL